MDTGDPIQALSRSDWTDQFYTKLHRYAELLKRRWWILGLTTAAALAVQAYRFQHIPATYASDGRMIVNAQLSIPGLTLPDNTLYKEEMQNFFGNQIALMQSQMVRIRAEERIQVTQPDLRPCQVDLRVNRAPGTSIFVFRAVGDEPMYTRAFLDACMKEYVAERQEKEAETSDTTLSAITAELSRLEKDLGAGEEALLEFQKANNIVFLEEQGNSASQYLATLNVKLADLQLEYELLQRLDLEQNLERQKAGAKEGEPAEIDKDQLSMDYLKGRNQIQMLKAELEDWSRYMKPKHPKIIRLKEDLQRQENLLQLYRQQSMDQLTSRRDSIQLQIKNLNSVIKEWEAKSLEASRGMAEYDKIKVRNQRLKSRHDRLLQTVQTVDFGKNLKQERITVYEQASPATPQKPGLARSLTSAGLLGLAFGFGLLWLMDRLNDRPASYAELRDCFEEPVLGQIPRDISTGKKTAIRPLEAEDSRHSFAEAYRNLRSALMFMAHEGRRPKLIMVTSAIPGEGKSTIAADLAITLALSTSRVLLVDADLRRGIVHQTFRAEINPGLSEVLEGKTPWRQAVGRHHSIPNLFLIPRGTIPANPGELFFSPSLEQLLQEAETEYDYVVVDSAPMLAADDPANLAPRVDGVIFVVRAEYTESRLARSALDQLYHRQANVLGLVFNSVNSRGREYYYYKYADYYSPASDKG